jgi:hypothetical protein
MASSWHLYGMIRNVGVVNSCLFKTFVARKKEKATNARIKIIRIKTLNTQFLNLVFLIYTSVNHVDTLFSPNTFGKLNSPNPLLLQKNLAGNHLTLICVLTLKAKLSG